MSLNIPTKSSSRAGRFKKKLVSPEGLVVEAPQIEAKMAPILELFNQQKITDAELTACYLIAVLSHRYPGSWAGSKIKQPLTTHTMPFKTQELCRHLEFEKNVLERLKQVETIGDLLAQCAFRSTPLAVNRSILEWSKGNYKLELMFRIPSPREVLQQQKVGRRCVTLLTKKEDTSLYILGERDALSFTMHDLIHADHFYRDLEVYEGQLGFYALLENCYEQGHFDELWGNRKFRDEFEYLISDMNAYAVHLMKCLKSAMIHYHPKRDEFFIEWIQKLELSPQEEQSLKLLNSKEYSAEVRDATILSWLNKYRVKGLT